MGAVKRGQGATAPARSRPVNCVRAAAIPVATRHYRDTWWSGVPTTTHQLGEFAVRRHYKSNNSSKSIATFDSARGRTMPQW